MVPNIYGVQIVVGGCPIANVHPALSTHVEVAPKDDQVLSLTLSTTTTQDPSLVFSPLQSALNDDYRGAI